MDSSELISKEQASAFEFESTELRIRRGRIACLLELFGIGSGVSLDYILYPALLGPLFATRMGAVVLIFLIYRTHDSHFGKQHIDKLNTSWAIVVNLSICMMVYLTEGASSPYYGALNLVFLGAGALLPWTYKEVIFLFCTMIGAYVTACVARGITHDETIAWSLLFNNCFFISLTGFIGATSSFFNTRSRVREYNLNLELNVQNRKLQDLDRMKSQFFANVSHELRPPLTLILSPIQDVLKTPEALSSNVAGLMRVARDNAFRLLKLVNDLLEVIKLEEGKTSLNLQPVELNQFVSGVVNSMMHMADTKGIVIKQSTSDQPVGAQVDIYALERVVLNLLSNAIKFTPEGGTISTRIRVENGFALVDVEDTGIGISDEDLPYIFDRFRQADSSSTRRYQGSGLGLALVKDLAEKMGGGIHVESKLDVGTTMSLSLPECLNRWMSRRIWTRSQPFINLPNRERPCRSVRRSSVLNRSCRRVIFLR